MQRFLISAATLALLVGSGCARTKPCMLIPAQVELAEEARDAAANNLEQKIQELNRFRHALEQSRERRDRLAEERDRLREEVGGGGVK